MSGWLKAIGILSGGPYRDLSGKRILSGPIGKSTDWRYRDQPIPIGTALLEVYRDLSGNQILSGNTEMKAYEVGAEILSNN